MTVLFSIWGAYMMVKGFQGLYGVPLATSLPHLSLSSGCGGTLGQGGNDAWGSG